MKELRIIPYLPKYKSEWDRFVQQSNNGTIFQSQKFLTYHPKKRFINTSLLFVESEKIVAVMPATTINDGGKLIFSSHGGASFGGIIHNSLGLSRATAIVELLLEHLKEKKVNIVRLTPSPIIYHRKPNQEIEFALYRKGFRFKKRELTSVLKVSNEDIKSLFKAEARTAMRKALKAGVTIRKCAEYKDFYTLLQNNLQNRYKVNPVHSYKELMNLVKMFPEDISLSAAYLDKVMIAGVVNFKCNQQVALAFYISQDYKYQELRPLNLLFYEIMQDLQKNEYYYYDLGLFTVNMEPNWGLGKFKESLGTTGVFRDYYELNL